MSETDKDLTEETLKTLSHFEPMSLEKVFLDFSQEFLRSHPEFLVEDLAEVLRKLKKQNKVKEMTIDGQKAWIKTFPQRGVLAKIKHFLRLK